jgi:hypothetical protein
LCVAGRGSLDEASAAMLAQLLRKHGIGARVAPSAAVSLPNLFALDATGVQMAYLCYLEPGSFTNPHYLVRRLRCKLPKATIVDGFWTLKADEADARNALTKTGPISSLRFCNNQSPRLPLRQEKLRTPILGPSFDRLRSSPYQRRPEATA